MLLLVAFKPIAELLDRPLFGTLISMVLSAAIVLALLAFARRLVPETARETTVAVEAAGGPRAGHLFGPCGQSASFLAVLAVHSGERGDHAGRAHLIPVI